MTEFGGPEVLQLAEVPEPASRPGHLPIQVTHAGVNMADVHVRTNTYLTEIPLPYVPGNEIVGLAKDGRRVAALTRGGGYAEHALAHRATTWQIPDGVSDEQACALALQGNSAWHLLHTVAGITAGTAVVIPAAAGGLGSLAVQLAVQAGARVIALASTPQRRELAQRLGAAAVVDSSSPDGLTERITDAAGGPVPLALEMTGGPTLTAIIEAVAPHGRLVVYGFASGAIGQLPVRVLLERSITVSGFWLPNLFRDRELMARGMSELFAQVQAGTLRPILGGVYPLAQAATAHHDLVSRTITGKLLLDTGH
jgi:NADPH2:quinone reductase